ncbi:DsbA family protein [Falsirhodobacter algicola]|uniref:Thioredoxin domain-containing protein n=1 Tax=Falsirhodobacter algicola TaxID=2692330 RepID=A0A8J8MT21_9RHOB|nr:DsbA family protein [Falsirhodobacter algicola]QUS36167.1 thioredoxin domain-containing protein [Falsirhodobacter algicola]
MTMKNAIASLALVAALGTFAATAASAQDTPAPAADAAETPAITVPDMALGQEDAPVTIIEYGSYTCPHCADFHENVMDKLKTDYIDTGKVRFIFREVYFDRYGLWAAMMARCGGEMRYFGIADILYDTQRDWAGSNDPAVVVQNLKRIGKTAGMDDATIDQCMQDGAMAQALVAEYEKNVAADGVEGTPTLFVNGEKHSNMSYDDLKKLIDAELN